MPIYSGNGGAGGRTAGVASLVINGEAVDIAADLTYDPTRVKREELVGQSGPQGFSETRKNGYMAFTLRDSRFLSVASIAELTGVSVVAQLANGKTVSGEDMWCMECQEVKTADATFAVRFASPIVEEY